MVESASLWTLAGWLHTKVFTCLQTVTRPSANWAQHRVTSLAETSQTTMPILFITFHRNSLSYNDEILTDDIAGSNIYTQQLCRE